MNEIILLLISISAGTAGMMASGVLKDKPALDRFLTTFTGVATALLAIVFTIKDCVHFAIEIFLKVQ